ncbi:selenoprotein S [Pseudoscourfieldia marina]
MTDAVTQSIGVIWGFLETYGWPLLLLVLLASYLSSFVSRALRADILNNSGLMGQKNNANNNGSRDQHMRQAMLAARERQQQEAEASVLLRKQREVELSKQRDSDLERKAERCGVAQTFKGKAQTAAGGGSDRPDGGDAPKPKPKPSSTATTSSHSLLNPAPSRPSFRPERRRPGRGG